MRHYVVPLPGLVPVQRLAFTRKVDQSGAFTLTKVDHSEFFTFLKGVILGYISLEIEGQRTSFFSIAL